jgi:phosphoenolpyruvate synthase/pyruvate phosphate dikinase
MSKKWVYLFSELDQAEAHAGGWDGARGLLGGKGANLADMTRIGVPVRDGKRTAQAEVRIAVDMVEEGLIAPREAVQRVQPGQVDFFLHPQLAPVARKQVTCIARGLDVSPGAAAGAVASTRASCPPWCPT